uniref:hypothetical protein n=1 Tax=Clostridium perfringens TaxID=1502 RepID=UPI0024BD1FA8
MELNSLTNFNLESISIEQATESDFSNSLSKDNKNEEPLDYFDIVFSIRAKNTSKNLCTDNIVPHIILPKELKSNGYIDIGLNPLSSTDEIILPGHEKGFPYKLFVKKGKYSKEELLKFWLCHNKQLINSHFYRGALKLPYKFEL